MGGEDIKMSRPPGSGSATQKNGSGTFHHQVKISRKPFISTVCDFFMTFYLIRMMLLYLKAKKNLKKNHVCRVG